MRRSLILLIALASVAPAYQAGTPFKPGKLPPAEVAALAQGMTLRFYAKPDAKTALDARRIRLAALHVPADSPPTPFLAPGPFHAKISGYLKNPLKGDYSFKLVGNGAITLKINDKSLLALPADKDKSVEVELAKNYNKIEILCTSPAKGDTTARLYWAGEKFDFEPVPPDVLYSRKDEEDLVEKTMLRDGRLLYADRRCAQCHALPGNIALPDCKMPELHNATVRLDDAGYRLQYDWLVAWITNPRPLRPKARMPRVLTGPDAEKDAADLAAYLSELKTGPAPQPLAKSPKAKDGEAIYKKLGCNSCHRLNAPQEKDELERNSLHHVGAKYQPSALARYLKQPHERYPWTRMPDFQLSDAEAAHVEAYLREKAIGKVSAAPKGDKDRGAKIFVSAGCQNCHPFKEPPKFFKFFGRLESLDKGCLAVKDLGKAPDFGLQPSQRAALTAFVKTDGLSLTRESPAEVSQRQVKALHCSSCHRRDGESTRWHAVLEDEGKEPEKLPSLTWIGEKLKPEWTKKMLDGTHDHRARPWLKARMPAFPARAEMLAVGLSHEHGFGIDEDERPRPDPKLAAIGEKLIPQQGGFNCINCHGIGKAPPTQPFEAPGINLFDAALRLRYHYYHRWMMSPDRVDVTMRMPVFATDGKTTQLKEVFDGDARRQYDALWHYIQTLPAK